MRRFRIDFMRPEDGKTVRWDDGSSDHIFPGDCKAVGVLWYDGTITVKWLATRGELMRQQPFESIEQIRALNDGKIDIRWEDPICFCCGATLDFNERASKHCFACGAGQSKELHFEDKPDPSLGSWKPALVIGGDGAATCGTGSKTSC